MEASIFAWVFHFIHFFFFRDVWQLANYIFVIRCENKSHIWIISCDENLWTANSHIHIFYARRFFIPAFHKGFNRGHMHISVRDWKYFTEMYGVDSRLGECYFRFDRSLCCCQSLVVPLDKCKQWNSSGTRTTNHENRTEISLDVTKSIFSYRHINAIERNLRETYSLLSLLLFFLRLLLVTTFIGQVDFWPRFVRRQVCQCVSSEHERTSGHLSSWMKEKLNSDIVCDSGRLHEISPERLNTWIESSLYLVDHSEFHAVSLAPLHSSPGHWMLIRWLCNCNVMSGWRDGCWNDHSDHLVNVSGAGHSTCNEITCAEAEANANGIKLLIVGLNASGPHHHHIILWVCVSVYVEQWLFSACVIYRRWPDEHTAEMNENNFFGLFLWRPHEPNCRPADANSMHAPKWK